MNIPSALGERATRSLRRVVVENVEPEVDGGRFAIKRTVGERVVVRADIFADGHDAVNAAVVYREVGEESWREIAMKLAKNDRWEAEFTPEKMGSYEYSVVGWADGFQSWARDLAKRIEAKQDVSVDLLSGAEMIDAAATLARGVDLQRLGAAAAELRKLPATDTKEILKFATSTELAELINRNRERSGDTRHAKDLVVTVDREKARFSTWYEMFPRSCTKDAKRHGTFRDCIERLDYIAGMGFDVLYLPPIHPIGQTERKGKNNCTEVKADDVGSPWAIGAREGGHKAIHPQLGSLEDLKLLQVKAREKGMELALDIAFQCSPDHPYVRQHREWFRTRQDGTVQYAENPPKKYQDIYPLDFESAHAEELWNELKSVVIYWINQGVRIFRVDNPHTKPFAFWEWLIAEIKREYPEVIFLAEAFTRPKVMYQLAKLGFTQSYTYFAWKNANWELAEYFTEISEPGIRDFFRPNVWPNTPDILNEYLQTGGRAAFAARLILAATLSGNYGIYGPAFELCEGRAVRKGSEEYLDSEKYQIRVWDREDANSLKDLITHVNGVRRGSAALQSNNGVHFHRVDNEQLVAYSRVTDDHSDMMLMVVNLDPHNMQAGWVDVVLAEFGLGSEESFQVHDLLTDAQYVWHGARNFVQLNPTVLPAHIFRVRAIG
ncbi:MAG TPA: alpha-1,4-glucan--maltose-1-phosphate maltosyltransferase [Candidatus Acidoferrum sp.]